VVREGELLKRKLRKAFIFVLSVLLSTKVVDLDLVAVVFLQECNDINSPISNG
jgi:hypothetical protein